MELQAELAGSPPSPWRRLRGWLVRVETFPDFQAAVGWANRVARQAERWNHHPDILIQWNKVTLRLRTHEQSKVTAKDLHWVEITERALRRKASPAGPDGATAVHQSRLRKNPRCLSETG